MCNIIVEIGQNHEGDYKQAIDLVKKAYLCGAKYIKLQYWNVDNIYHKEDIRYEGAKKRELPFNAIMDLLDLIVDFRVTPIISFFGATMEQKDILFNRTVAMIKYAYSERFDFFKDYENIKNKVIVSIDRKDNISKFRRLEKKPILLVCKPEYPAKHIKEELIFMANNNLGFSDHTVGIDAMKSAILLGSQWIEKHFTTDELRKNSNFRDHTCSMTTSELKCLLDFIEHQNDLDYIKKDTEGYRRLKLI